MQPKRRLIVFIKRSTNTMTLWTFACAIIMLIFFCLQKFLFLFPIKHLA